MSPGKPLDPQTLLAHADWVRGLARRLVLYEARALDVEQEVWIVALREGRLESGSLRAWLAGVTRNVARQMGRADARRVARERSSARSEALESAADVAERAAVQRDLVTRVLELDEPFRTVVLLRYFDDLEPQAIAERLGVNASTVRTRLARAHEKLRERLAKEHGEGRAWCLVLLPLARMDKSAAGAAAGASGATLFGGLLMLNWKLWAAALVAASALFLVLRMQGEDDPEQRVVAGETARADVELASPRPAEPSAPDARRAAAIDLAPEPAAAEHVDVRGRVLDEAGRPLVSVEVVWARVRGMEYSQVTGVHETMLDDARPVPAVRTDDQGRYALRAPKGASVLLFGSRGRTHLGYGIEPTDGVRVDVLVPCVDVAGRVLDADGRPVAKAVVAVTSSLRALPTFPIALRDIRHERDRVAVRTDDAGRYRIECAPSAGCGTIDAELRELRSGAVPVPQRSTSGLDFTLTGTEARELVVSGRVLDAAGAMVAKATVALGRSSTRSDRDGRFRLRIDPEREQATGAELLAWIATCDLVAGAPGAQPCVLPAFGARFADVAEPTDVELQLGAPTLTITGRVIDAKGQPVEGCTVNTADGDPIGRSGRRVEQLCGLEPAHTKSDGRFVLRGLRPRDYRLRCVRESDGANVTSQPITAGASGVELAIPDHALRELLAGQIVDVDGAPFGNADVQLVVLALDSIVDGFVSVREFTTDSEGRFELPRVPRTDARIALWGLDVKDLILDIPNGTSDRGNTFVATRMLRFRIEPRPGEAARSFRVLDRDHEPLPVRVHAVDKTWMDVALAHLSRDATQNYSVAQSATTLVLLDGDRELRRLPLTLAPDSVTTVIP
ncbi:MAG: sigma-70 family RNA polymerase sigma factor [Planctomycetes bacterium]|nr:sigma-70 family RNA polymerase sigma factor [Planctomycetota bacterium]